jgi:hypothetical protein
MISWNVNAAKFRSSGKPARAEICDDRATSSERGCDVEVSSDLVSVKVSTAIPL